MNYENLVRKLVERPSENTDSPSVATRRRYRAQGGSVNGFARIVGSAKAGDIAATAITAERLAGVGCDGETDTTGFKAQNRQQRASSEERRKQERVRVDAAIERNAQGEDSEAETEQHYEAEERSRDIAASGSRGRARAVGLEAVNAEYAKRKGVNIARVS